MQKQKKLTLQEYIECHNIKKQLQERSKSKSRGKSKDKSLSKTNLNINPNDFSAAGELKSKQNSPNKLRITQMNHQQFNESIYSQIDFHARNLYFEIQAQINQIKLQMHQYIKRDKDYAYFIKLMDSLMQKFRQRVMHNHRQNLLLFQKSYQDLEKSLNQNNHNTSLGSKNDFARAVLQKSFDDKWMESKNQYEANMVFMPHKTIKQKMSEKRKGEDLLKIIFGGGLFGTISGDKNSNDEKMTAPKKYDQQPQNQQQRARRKQQATSFLGHILRNNAQMRHNSQLDRNNQKPQIINQPIKPTSNTIQIKSKTQNNTFQIKPPKPVNFLIAQRNQGDKILKNINILNSSGKVNINTQDIDNYFDEHNVSFGGQDIKTSIQKVKHPLSKEKANFQKIDKNKVTKQLTTQKNVLLRIPHIGSIKGSKQKQRFPSKNQAKRQSGKTPPVPSAITTKSPQNNTMLPSNNALSNQYLCRTGNSKSKGKQIVIKQNINNANQKYLQKQ